jgi:hypothetical protein
VGPVGPHRREIWREKNSHVEAETDWNQKPRVGIGQHEEGPSPENFLELMACPHVAFGLLATRTVGKPMSIVQATPFEVLCVAAHGQQLTWCSVSGEDSGCSWDSPWSKAIM